jgi:hypothetical protein
LPKNSRLQIQRPDSSAKQHPDRRGSGGDPGNVLKRLFPATGKETRTLEVDAYTVTRIEVPGVLKTTGGQFLPRNPTWLADRGMVRQATLEAFENSDPPIRYIGWSANPSAEGS